MAKRKKQIIEELEALGIKCNEEDTVKELSALLKEAEEAEEDGEEESDDSDEPEDDEPPKKGKYKLRDANGNLYPTTFSTLEEAEERAKAISGRVEK